MPHFKAFCMMNLRYEIRICQKIYNKGTITVTILLSGTDVNLYYVPWIQIITKLFVRGVILLLLKPRNYFGHNIYDEEILLAHSKECPFKTCF